MIVGPSAGGTAPLGGAAALGGAGVWGTGQTSGGTTAAPGGAGSEAGTGSEAGATGGDAGTAGSEAGTSGSGSSAPFSDLRGTVKSGVRQFFAIPYAKPPVGELRFKAPVKNDPWDGVRDATELPGRCAQPSSLNTGAGTDNEDCLYLNVWTPEEVSSTPLPVLFWIHGGGNQTGSTADLVPIVGGRLFYDGQSFAEHHDVVMVSTNYRLGVFGYLSHSGLTEEGSPSGNQGLRDQQMALEWVRDNIAAFGGDAICFGQPRPDDTGALDRYVSIGRSGVARPRRQ